MKRFLSLSLSVLLLAASRLLAQQPPSHVRVIQDTSLSLSQQNDKGRLAVMATALLRDLAYPSLGVDGSFEVMTFDRDLIWTDTTSPPVQIGHRLSTSWARSPRGGSPDPFLMDLFALPYDAKMTYFYPGLKAAIDDLERAPGGRDARRVIVIVTDGLPEAATRAKEEEWIERDLVPRLVNPVSGRIQVHVLAFGPEAAKNTDFFRKITEPNGATKLGDVQSDLDGRQMLLMMTRIFTSGFGYIAEEAPNSTRIPLSHAAAERAAVVAYWDYAQPRPTFDLTPLNAGSYNFSPTEVLPGSDPTSKAAYALRWVLSPQQRGDGRVTGFAGSPRFAVLRPTEVRLSFEPSAPGQRDDLALAGRPLNMKIRARNVSGAQAAPADGLDTSYEILIPTSGSRDEYSRVPSRDSHSDFGKVPPGNNYREYDVSITFPADTVPGRDYYTGIVEAEATRGQSLVSTLRWPDAHRVTVYPNVNLIPLPQDADVRKGGRTGPIGRFENGWCADFHFEVTGGLNENRPYTLRAVLDPQQPLPPGIELHLDEDRINLSKLQAMALATGERPQDWYSGVPLKLTQMRGDHHLCVSTTKPNSGMQLTVPVRFSLEEFPYNYFDVVAPFSVRLTLAAPDFWSRWAAALLLLFLLLLLLTLAWLSRFLPKLAPDLGFVNPDTAIGSAPVFHRLAPETILGRFILQERAVVSDGTMLGWIRPREKDLYDFRPAEQGVLESENKGEWRPLHPERRNGRDYYAVVVGRTYSWKGEGRKELFQLEFEKS